VQGQQTLIVADEICARIENATRNVKEDYEKALETVGTLKEKMNESEQRIGQKKPEETRGDMASLRSAIDSLERLTDTEILKSKTAWKKYEELKHDCELHALAPPQLDELQILCKRTEQLAGRSTVLFPWASQAEKH
jgi:predicted house-cleaning noncanonical NTP pyrophosphatase (MazG superfamily)